jgi:hypothetical protein
MSEMIDRVADALKESFKATIADGAGVPFEQTGVVLPADAVWQRYAHAVVTAMREPTSAMLKADVALGVTHYEDDEDNLYATDENLRDTWRAMIDEALAP